MTRMEMSARTVVSLLVAGWLAAVPLAGQTPGGPPPPAPVAAAGQAAPGAPPPSAAELAKKLANPIADLVSIPFQFNWDEGVGTNDDLRFLLNLQPVLPVSISEKWNVVNRFVFPMMLSQPPLVPGAETTFGAGDIVFSNFFSPKEPGRLIWGVGPVFSLPTTSNPFLGSGKWSIGPTFVVLKQMGPWTAGFLGNHLWSFADTGDVEREDVSQTWLQPFFSHSSKSGVTISLSSEASANWKADSGEEWIVPLILMVQKLTRLGPFPFQMGIGYAYYVEHPSIGPKWKLRMNFVVLLPRAMQARPAR